MTAPYPQTDGTQACGRVDPELFFQADPRAAIGACSTCPFKAPCLAYALTHDVRGVWGGTTWPTRNEIRRKHGIKAVQLELSDAATRIEKVHQLTANGLSAAEIAERLGYSAPRAATRARGYQTT